MHTPTDSEMLEEFTSVQHRPDGIAIRVCRITWTGPHTSKIHWHTVALLPLGSAESGVAVERRKLLDNPKYFSVCAECRERTPAGWMHDAAICQSCATRNHGVVY